MKRHPRPHARRRLLRRSLTSFLLHEDNCQNLITADIRCVMLLVGMVTNTRRFRWVNLLATSTSLSILLTVTQNGLHSVCDEYLDLSRPYHNQKAKSLAAFFEAVGASYRASRAYRVDLCRQRKSSRYSAITKIYGLPGTLLKCILRTKLREIRLRAHSSCRVDTMYLVHS